MKYFEKYINYLILTFFDDGFIITHHRILNIIWLELTFFDNTFIITHRRILNIIWLELTFFDDAFTITRHRILNNIWLELTFFDDTFIITHHRILNIIWLELTFFVELKLDWSLSHGFYELNKVYIICYLSSCWCLYILMKHKLNIRFRMVFISWIKCILWSTYHVDSDHIYWWNTNWIFASVWYLSIE